jgi:DNA primase
VSIAQFLEYEHPDLIVAEMAKAKRKGQVFFSHSPKETLIVWTFGSPRPRLCSHKLLVLAIFTYQSKEAAEKR